MEAAFSQHDDRSLLRIYAGVGDPSAFSAIVQRYAAMVFAAARRVTGDATAAEDVTQDCFLKLAQSAPRITGSIPAWLHRTSVNRAVEIRRSEQARKLREARAARSRETVADEASNLDASRLIAEVDEALIALPDDLRFVVTEHFLCGKTQSEMAAVMGVNQSTIQRRLQTGLELLRQKLQGNDRRPVPLALPMLLAGLPKSPVSERLMQSIYKIGLAHPRDPEVVSYPVGASGPKTAAMKIVLSCLLLVGASAVAIRYIADAHSQAPALNLNQLPAAVRVTLDGHVPAGAVFGEMDRKHDGDRIVYDIDVTVNGKLHELRIADDGTLIFDKP